MADDDFNLNEQKVYCWQRYSIMLVNIYFLSAFQFLFENYCFLNITVSKKTCNFSVIYVVYTKFKIVYQQQNLVNRENSRDLLRL